MKEPTISDKVIHRKRGVGVQRKKKETEIKQRLNAITIK